MSSIETLSRQQLADDNQQLRNRLLEVENELKQLREQQSAEISERITNAHALELSEARLRAICENFPHPLFMKDRQARVLIANPAALAAIGKLESEVIGQTAMTWISDPEQRRQFLAHDLRVMDSGCAERFEVEFGPPGAHRLYEVFKIPIRDDSGTVIGLVGTSRDITEERNEKILKDLECELVRSNEERTRATFELAAIGIADVGLEGRFLRVNQKFCDIVGYTRDELLALTFQDISHPDELRIDLNYVRQLIAGEIPSFAMEKRYIRKDGSHVWTEIHVAAARSADGTPEYFVSVIDDISARKLAQKELFETNQRLQALMTALPVGVSFSDDATCQRITGNPTVLAQFEVSPSDNLSASAPDASAPGRQIRFFLQGREIRDSELPLQRATAENAVIPPMELEIHLPNGRRWFAQASGAPVRNVHGQVIGGVAVTMDVTGRKRSEDELIEQTAKIMRLVESNIIGVVFADMEKIVRANDAYLKIVGYDRADLAAGRIRWREMTPPEFTHLDETALQELARTGVCTPFQKEYFRKDGTRVPVLIGVAKLSEQSPMWVCYIVDLTQQKRAEDALKEADRRKDEFLAMLAHELRNPLASINNALQLFGRLASKTPILEHSGEIIQRQINHMVRLVDDLFDLSRITHGKLELRNEHVNIGSVLTAAIEICRAQLEGKSQRLTVSLPPENLFIHGDPTRLAQVVSNLLNNAVKFTPNGGQISLIAGQENRELVIRVRDNGVGIDPELIPSLFAIFSQGGVQRERAQAGQGGLGIGLFLVDRIVKLHGGTVKALSAGPNQGSEFVIRLPLISPPDVQHVPEVISVAAARQRVLIVDDDFDSAETLAMLLQSMNHEVRTVNDSQTALESAVSFAPDIILMDISMPGINGYEIARQMRALPALKDTALVALTGWGKEEDRQRSVEAGFDQHLIKPVSLQELEQLFTQRNHRKP